MTEVVYDIEADVRAWMFGADWKPGDHPRDRKGRFRKKGGGVPQDPAGGWTWDDPAVGEALARLPDDLREGLKNRGLRIQAAATDLSNVLPGVSPGQIDGAYFNKRTEMNPDPGMWKYARREFIDTRSPFGQGVPEGKHEAEWITLHETGHAFDDLYPELVGRPLSFISESSEWTHLLEAVHRSAYVRDHDYFADAFAEANGAAVPPGYGPGRHPEEELNWIRQKMSEAEA